MGVLAYYIALPFLYAIAWLPFPLLYLLSDLTYVLIYHVLKYRRGVVITNLRNSFPDMEEAELQRTAARFYRYFCDLVLETVKTLAITRKAVRDRVDFSGTEILRTYAERGQSVVLVLGHLGNWELAGARYSVEPGLPQLHVIYHPLQNEHFDRLMIRMRTRLGTKLYTMRETAKAMLRDRHLVTATAFIADQTPPPETAYWTTFLNQDTPVFLGTETLARKLGYPVVYIAVTRPVRGRYQLTAETLVENPGETRAGEITEKHTERLERDIRKHPDLWLWTHRRWKHKRHSA